jgi:two-component system cell cycle sensor histidine kinase PleC
MGAPVFPCTLDTGFMGSIDSLNWSAGLWRQGRSPNTERVQGPAEAAHAGGAPDFDYDLLLMFVRNERVAALTVPILAIVFAVIMLSWSQPRPLLLWLATIFISEGILLALCREFRKQPRRTADLNQWRRKLAAAEFLYGVSWAALAFTELSRPAGAAYFFLFAALMVVTAIRMLFAASVLPILHAGTIPVTAALCLRFLMTGEVFYWLMAVVAAGIHFYFVFLVKGLRGIALSMLEHRAEKDDLIAEKDWLIAELEEEKAASDEARARAEAANLAKSKFLANMSHELRTPLNAILGFAEIMKDEILGPAGNASYKTYASDIHASGEHLLKLINEILDLSRIEAGRYELTEKPVDFGGIARECLNLLRLDAQAKNLRLITTFKPDMPKIMADELALRQICLNLLANAIKFTPQDGAVALRTGLLRGGEVFLSVSDNGPGIPEEEIPQVLQAFGQGSVAVRETGTGTGLGLPIVTGLAELHGGRFELRSKVGEGTEAKVVLPRSRVIPSYPGLGRGKAAETILPFLRGAA